MGLNKGLFVGLPEYLVFSEGPPVLAFEDGGKHFLFKCNSRIVTSLVPEPGTAGLLCRPPVKSTEMSQDSRRPW